MDKMNVKNMFCSDMGNIEEKLFKESKPCNPMEGDFKIVESFDQPKVKDLMEHPKKSKKYENEPED